MVTLWAGRLWKRMEYFQKSPFLMQEKTRNHVDQGNVLNELYEETSHKLHHHVVSKTLKYKPICLQTKMTSKLISSVLFSLIPLSYPSIYLFDPPLF